MRCLIAAVTACLSLAVACPTAHTASPPKGGTRVQLKLFAKPQRWGFDSGPEFPGAKGSFRLGADDGRMVGILAYNFASGGNYVDAATRVYISKAEALSFNVESSLQQRLLIRVIDSSGQVLQFHKFYSSPGRWQTLRVGMTKGSPAHWDGRNDGVIHFPITQLAIGVGNVGKVKSGKVKFAAFVAEDASGAVNGPAAAPSASVPAYAGQKEPPAAMPPTNPPPLRGLGVDAHFGRDANWDVDYVLPLMKRMGVSIVRLEIPWSKVERTKGQYSLFPAAKHFCDALAHAGIKMIAVLDGTNPIYKNPIDRKAFARYASWVTRAIHRDVAAYEIWNEPWNFSFRQRYGGAWNGRGNAPWLAQYARFVHTAVVAMRKVNPKAVIIQNLDGPMWVYALHRYPQDFTGTDGIDLHPYPDRFPPETLPWGGFAIRRRDGVSVDDNRHGLLSYLDILSRLDPERYLGHALQCWVGEFGYSTYTPERQNGLGEGYTPRVQAAYLVRGLLLGLTAGVRAFCLYDMVDDSPNPFDPECNYGLVDPRSEGYRPKPAFYAIRRVAQWLGPHWKSIAPAPARLEVSLLPSDKHVWQAPPQAGWVQINGAEVRWFRVGDTYVTFLWKAGRACREQNPPMGKILWPHAPQIVALQAEDVVSGQLLSVSVSRRGNTLEVSGLPVGWSPTAIRWILQETSGPGRR